MPALHRGGAGTLVTAATLALSAFLLFLVEPLAARMLLPAFGGAAAVWLTAMLFFQAALLCGYLLADRSSRLLSPRAQSITFVALAAAGLLFLPTSPAALLADSPHPSLRVLASLAASVGVPFLALSASGPLLQSFWARAHGAPWRLYALSNAASLLGLLAYPALFEPLLDLPGQARLWAAGYLLFTVLAALASWQALRATASAAPPIAAAAIADGAAIDATPPRRWAWLVVPACTSALLLSVTGHLTRNVAPIPLLWILPLALYLLSFVLAFESARPPRRILWLPLCVAGLGYLAHAASAAPPAHARPAIALELLAFLAVCVAAHGELVRERPAAAETTRFYLRLSLGSALGAVFVVVLAPLWFRTELELPCSLLGLGLSIAFLLWREPLLVPRLVPSRRIARALSIVCLDVLAIQLAVGEAQGRGTLQWAGRSFYGALRVADDRSAPGMPARMLFHGSTLHGQELLPPGDPATPLGYYGVSSGAGRTLRALQESHASLRVGVVGLGVGVLASYCRPADHFTFYEIDPLVIEVAKSRFDFLGRCPGSEILLGDARLTLAAQEPQQFDLLVLDAFSSDAIPIHLLTREAFALFRRHLAPGGLLLVHASNRFVDLGPVVAGHAAAAGLSTFHLEEDADFAHLRFPNVYLLLAPDGSLLRAPAFSGVDVLRKLGPSPGFRDWTDAYSNLAGLLN